MPLPASGGLLTIFGVPRLVEASPNLWFLLLNMAFFLCLYLYYPDLPFQ